MRQFLMAIAMITIGNIAIAQEETSSSSPHKIVFQLTTGDSLAHRSLMKQISNITSVAPDTRIEVVCHGPGLDMLVKEKTTVAPQIKKHAVAGIEFMACEFSMKERKVNKVSILSESGFVKAGIIEIVKKQEEGWSYIKSGF